MATVAVLADPPVEGFVLGDVAESTPLSEREAAQLYSAMLTDVCRAIELGGATLLVNFRAPEQAPEGVDPESQVRALLGETLDQPDEARYEVQVGETFAGRVGNTVTHLLESEGADTAAAVTPSAVFLNRELVGSAAMKLRSSEVVLGPAADGRVYYAGFREPIDFTDAYEPPAVGTLTDRAADAEFDTDFLPMTPIVETGSDLVTAVAHLRARLRAGRNVPPRTASFVHEQGLGVEETTDGLRLTRDSA
jgi:hypothetical protein